MDAETGLACGRPSRKQHRPETVLDRELNLAIVVEVQQRIVASRIIWSCHRSFSPCPSVSSRFRDSPMFALNCLHGQTPSPKKGKQFFVLCSIETLSRVREDEEAGPPPGRRRERDPHPHPPPAICPLLRHLLSNSPQ